MRLPTSDLFIPLSLDDSFNCERETLDERLRLRADDAFGQQSFRGIPFALGAPNEANAILLDGDEARVAAGDRRATYIVFAHIVEDRTLTLTPDFKGFQDSEHREGATPGNDLGDLVAEYQLHYADGSSASVPIRRRFAIQQAHIEWGASAFAAVPHQQDTVSGSSAEAFALGRAPGTRYGYGETRHSSGRDAASEHIWLYALPNPQPEKLIREIRLVGKDERALIYGISTTQVDSAPVASARETQAGADLARRRSLQRDR